MKEFKYVIRDAMGIHARPAGLLVKEASEYRSTVMVLSGSRAADAKRIMSIMSLGVKHGTEVTVVIEGEDEDAALEGMKAFFQKNL